MVKRAINKSKKMFAAVFLMSEGQYQFTSDFDCSDTLGKKQSHDQTWLLQQHHASVTHST